MPISRFMIWVALVEVGAVTAEAPVVVASAEPAVAVPAVAVASWEAVSVLAG